MTPLATCITLTYNRHRLLEEVLYMFLHQTWESKHLLIVNNDYNVDYTYVHKDVSIINVKDKNLNGFGKLSNYAKNAVSGDYYFFMEDDDVYYTRHLERLIVNSNPALYDIVKNRYSHSSVDNIINNKQAQNLFFSGMCISKDYIKSNDFDIYQTYNLDGLYTDKAFKNNRVNYVDGNTTHHYRWGMNTYHLSGRGDDKSAWDKCREEGYEVKNQTIELIPQLLDTTKQYYH